MTSEFFDALATLGEENKISKDVLIEKIKDAMYKAVKKAYPDCEEYIEVEIDPDAKKFNVYIRQTVVPDEPTYYNEVNIDVARAIDRGAYVGGTVRTPIDITSFSRAAAQTAKQAIRGDIREINKEHLLEKFSGKENECVTAEVSQVDDSGAVTVIYDNTELYLSRNEKIPGETFTVGQKVKIYIVGIANKQKKPMVKISRSRKEFVKRLFELEVPEIYDGTVEIKAISREPGRRTKIAVWSKDKNVDPVGACIGPKRTRISSIVKELSGEKIDIIVWDENPEIFITKAIAPAKVVKTIIYPGDQKSCMVVVPASQLSLAIGNGGQNAKLAAKLTGYKIDIKPDDDPEAIEEMKKADEMMTIDESGEDMFEADTENTNETITSEEAENIDLDETLEKNDAETESISTDETIDLGEDETADDALFESEENNI